MRIDAHNICILSKVLCILPSYAWTHKDQPRDIHLSRYELLKFQMMLCSVSWAIFIRPSKKVSLNNSNNHYPSQCPCRYACEFPKLQVEKSVSRFHHVINLVILYCPIINILPRVVSKIWPEKKRNMIQNATQLLLLH